MDLRDLPPKADPKGGSTRTPTGGVPLREYQEYVAANGTIWKMATSILSGLFIMSIVAYFTALQAKGVSHVEMTSYVGDFYKDKELLIAAQNIRQDQDIGKLIGGEEHITVRLNSIDVELATDKKDIDELRTKMELLGNYLEELRKSKR